MQSDNHCSKGSWMRLWASNWVHCNQFSLPGNILINQLFCNLIGRVNLRFIPIPGREGGIRTHGTLARSSVFKTEGINHSPTSPICVGFFVRHPTVWHTQPILRFVCGGGGFLIVAGPQSYICWLGIQDSNLD